MTDIDLASHTYRRENPPQDKNVDGSERKHGSPPRKDLDPAQVFKLAALGANNVEIANFFGVSEGLIRKRYQDVVDAGRNNIKLRLRQAQVREALGGNITMLIWLGKNMLNQSDTGARDDAETQPLPWSED
jgi:hypothetical protein